MIKWFPNKNLNKIKDKYKMAHQTIQKIFLDLMDWDVCNFGRFNSSRSWFHKFN